VSYSRSVHREWTERACGGGDTLGRTRKGESGHDESELIFAWRYSAQIFLTLSWWPVFCSDQSDAGTAGIGDLSNACIPAHT